MNTERLIEHIQNRLELHPIDVEHSPLNHKPVAEAYYEGRAEAYKEILRFLRSQCNTES